MAAIAESRPVIAEVAVALARLADLLSLEPAWDGEAALAPSPTALRNAMRFLIEYLPSGPAPAVGPGIDSSIEMEWESRNRPSVSVTFDPDGLAYFTCFTKAAVLREFQVMVGPDLAAAVIEFLG